MQNKRGIFVGVLGATFLLIPMSVDADQSKREIYEVYCGAAKESMPSKLKKLSRNEIKAHCGGVQKNIATGAGTYIQEYEVGGGSMAHAGIYHGSVIRVEMGAAPVIGDIAMFSSAICGPSCIKKLTAKNGGCYWLEGRPGTWGNGNYSIDSTRFGWLCGQDISITGVVRS